MYYVCGSFVTLYLSYVGYAAWVITTCTDNIESRWFPLHSRFVLINLSLARWYVVKHIVVLLQADAWDQENNTCKGNRNTNLTAMHDIDLWSISGILEGYSSHTKLGRSRTRIVLASLCLNTVFTRMEVSRVSIVEQLHDFSRVMRLS